MRCFEKKQGWKYGSIGFCYLPFACIDGRVRDGDWRRRDRQNKKGGSKAEQHAYLQQNAFSLFVCLFACFLLKILNQSATMALPRLCRR
mmetsp:Transcript_30685/g.80217  ORF Transcript_30685/g.80217 Transcript_30685/m.80217 type:complete len:89 (+) Transcript_30685:1956-2222(+)